MKKKEIQQLNTHSSEELRRKIEESRRTLRNLKFDFAAGKLKNAHEIEETKKAIARMLTFLSVRREGAGEISS